MPLVVPLVLLRHYVRKLREPYLARQVWPDPHPAELAPRYHVSGGRLSTQPARDTP